MVTVKNRLVEILEKEPYIHLQIELAEELGVSREYIRQVVNELHLRQLLGKKVGHPFVSCSKCGKPTRSKARREGQLCRKCYLKKMEKRKRTLICDTCGKEFKRKLGEFNASIKKKSKHTFCSRRCMGKWLGNTYGLAVHRENIGGKRMVKKIEIEEIKKAEVPPKATKGYTEILDKCIHLEGDQALKIKCETYNDASAVRATLRRYFNRLSINCEASSRTIGENHYVFIWKKD